MNGSKDERALSIDTSFDTLERTSQLYTSTLHSHKPFHLIHRLFLRHIRSKHEKQYESDGSPAVFVTDNARGLKTPCYRWTPRTALSATNAEASPDDTVTRSSNWRPVLWEKVKGAIFYVHGIGSHARFDLLAPKCLEILPSLGSRTDLSENEEKKLAQSADDDGSAQEIFEGSWASELTRAGFVLYAPDLEAHGLAQSINSHRCSFLNIDQLIDHQITWLERLAACGELPSGSTPIFLAGNATGGAIALRMIQSAFAANRFGTDTKARPNDQPSTQVTLRGCLLFSPTIAAEAFAERMSVKWSRWSTRFCSQCNVRPQEMDERFPYVSKLFRNDCLTLGAALPARKSRQLFKMTKAARRGYNSMPPELALFLCHSALDTLSDPEGSEYFMRHSKSDDKTSHFIDYGWHCLSKEPGFLLTIRLAVQWMLERV